ncbi:MAG: Gfo/Idh/MocA family oxidoreductase [Clostridia bacterium]
MKIAIVGTGLIAHTNTEALLGTGRCEIAALCNRTREKAEAFAQEYALSVPIFTDCDQMLAYGQFDAVLLNTPHAAHKAQVIACAKAGKHILVEKPLGISYRECAEMLDAVHKAGVNAAVCHTQRYLGIIRAMKAYVHCAEGAWLGKLRHAEDGINFAYFHDRRPKWFFDPAQAGGGMLLTHGAHQIDRLHWLLDVSESTVLAAHLEELNAYAGIDSGYQWMGMAGDVSYTVSCSGYPSPHSSYVKMDFENGCLLAELFDNGLTKAGLYAGDENGYRPLPVSFAQEDGYLRQMNDLLDCLQGKPSDAPTLRYAAALVHVLDQVKALGE